MICLTFYIMYTVFKRSTPSFIIQQTVSESFRLVELLPMYFHLINFQIPLTDSNPYDILSSTVQLYFPPSSVWTLTIINLWTVPSTSILKRSHFTVPHSTFSSALHHIAGWFSTEISHSNDAVPCSVTSRLDKSLVNWTSWSFCSLKTWHLRKYCNS